MNEARIKSQSLQDDETKTNNQTDSKNENENSSQKRSRLRVRVHSIENEDQASTSRNRLSYARSISDMHTADDSVRRRVRIREHKDEDEVHASFRLSVNGSDDKASNRVKIEEITDSDKESTSYVIKMKKPNEETEKYKIRINELEEKLKNMDEKNDQIKKLEEELEKMRKKDKKSSTSDKEFSKTKDELNKLKKIQEEKDKESDKLKEELQTLKLQVKSLKEKEKDLLMKSEEIIKLKMNLSSSEETIKKARKENEDVVKKLKDDIDKLEKGSNSLKEEIKLYKKNKAKDDEDKFQEINKLKKEFSDNEKKYKELIESKENDNKKKEENIKKLKEKITKLEKNQEAVKTKDDKTSKNILTVRNKFTKNDVNTNDDDITILKNNLKSSEVLIKKLQSENDEFRKEVESLARELDELHDTFREDQVSEYRDVKRELEIALKNCRVAQFKLKKFEKKCDSLEDEKMELEKKIKELIDTSIVSFDKKRMKELEAELNLAKEVSIHMHQEMEQLRTENEKLNSSLLESSLQQQTSQLPAAHSPSSSLSAPSSTYKTHLSPQTSIEQSKEYEELVHSLYDTMEREKDLQEQLKFSEEESRNVRKKLSTMEQENEILMMQIRKMAAKRGQNEEIDEDDELNPEQMKLTLELYEQEITVLRKKTDEVEQENDNLTHEIKYLQEKLVSQPLTKLELPEIPAGSPVNVIYNHKIRLLEIEARELRKKLVEKEKENESLRTEIDIHRRKASKVISRSRSLESDTQVDLKKQLQLVEQEATILRQKLTVLENDNDKLANENKRLQLRVSRKPPLTNADKLSIENIELKNRIKELELKCDNIKSELIESKLSTNLVDIIKDIRKPFKENLLQSENELINSLKQQLLIKDEEEVQLKRKLTTIELELSKLQIEYKKMKENLNYKKKPFPAIKEMTTRMELKEIIHELQDEMIKLQSILGARETLNENLEDEINELKKGLESAQHDKKTLEIKYNQEKEKYDEEMQKFKKEMEEMKLECDSYVRKLELLAKEGKNVNLVNKLESVEKEKRSFKEQLDQIASRMNEEENKVNDLVNKINNVTKSKNELQEKFDMMEKEKKKLKKELSDLSEKNKSYDQQLNLVKKDCNIKDSTINKLKSDCVQLKNQLDEESKKSKNAISDLLDDTKAREYLKKQIKDLENQNELIKKELDNMKNTQETNKNLNEKLNQATIKEKAMENEINELKEDNMASKTKIQSLNKSLDKLNNEIRESNEKQKSLNQQLKREKDEYENKLSSFELQLRNEQRKREKIERESELNLKTKDENLLHSKERIFQLEREMKRMQILLEQETRDNKIKVSTLERDLSKSQKEYDDLTSRYEVLEEELITIKAKLNSEKDMFCEKIASIKASYEKELSLIRNEYNNKSLTETAKEKKRLEERINFLENKCNQLEKFENDYNQLKSLLNDKEKKIDEMNQKERLQKKEIEQLNCKLNEMKLLSPVNKNDDDKKLKEMQNMKNRMDHAEISHKGEMAAIKVEYETRMKLMRDEIDLLLSERDALKMRLQLECVGTDVIDNDKINIFKNEIEDLKAQLDTIRGHLELSLLENRTMKINHASEKSSWKIQIAELKTRLNQLDEQSLMEVSRGSNRGYAKTRLELAWDKERNEQQKLLADTQKLVNEFREKLIMLEKTRDKERTEARKQLHELKLIMDKEQEDTQKRIGELQLDLIDLRESHAKIRSQNDRLKREKISLEKEREEFKLKLFTAISIENRINDIYMQFNELDDKIPSSDDIKSVKNLTCDTNGLRTIMDQFKVKIEELRKITLNKDSDLFKRTMSFRRAISNDMNPSLSNINRPLTIHRPPRPKALAKKSLSLDQHIVSNSSQEKIWDSGDESINTTPGSSVSNLRYIGSYHRGVYSSISGYESEGSFGDRCTREGSWGSDTSAPVMSSVVKPRKKSLFGLLKKTRSIGDNTEDNRHKKESSLKSKISKTITKTFSKSSSNLNKNGKDSSDKKVKDKPNQYPISKTNISTMKPPLGYQTLQSSRITDSREFKKDEDITKIGSLPRSTRV